MENTERNSNGWIAAIQRIVGADHARLATAQDSVEGVAPTCVVEPATATELAQVLALANSAGARLIPRGNGTKLDWGNPPTGAEIILSTARLNRILEHAAGDMTATVQAGCTLGELQKTLAKCGQRLALDGHWEGSATVGGIIAANDSGALRAAYGTLRDHLIGVTVALADGTIAKSGGKVVKNVAGYDLPKLFIGSLGTLGAIVEATFRLYPLAKVTRNVQFIAQSSAMLGRMIAALTQCALVTSGVQVATGKTGPIRVSVLIEGLPGSIEGKLQRVVRAALDCGAAQGDCGAVAREELSPAGLGENSIDDLRMERERLFADGAVCVCKISLLPTRWAGFLDSAGSVCAPKNVDWKIVGQAMGVGLMQLAGSETVSVVDCISSLRTELEKQGGSLVILRCPPSMKQQIDVWSDGGNALPLMRRIKAQFDPNGILSPGRFIGGI